MRRILLVLAVAAMMATMLGVAAPAFAAAPNGGCPTGFDEGLYDFGENSNGVPSAQVNNTDPICTKKLKAEPQNPAWEPAPEIIVFTDDVVGGGQP